ncbi:MAG: hypothetical protein ONB05_00690 [candidate division KSB1 bacterium]|nr:hypothetical protein [candidate division KSB1 bacterium]
MSIFRYWGVVNKGLEDELVPGRKLSFVVSTPTGWERNLDKSYVKK